MHLDSIIDVCYVKIHDLCGYEVVSSLVLLALTSV